MPRSPVDVFTIREVARAAGVRPERVRAWAEAAGIGVFRGFVRQADAVALVKDLSSLGPETTRNRAAIGLSGRTRRNFVSLFGSGVLHGILLAALALLASYGFLTTSDTDQRVLPLPAPTRLVFLISPGLDGGGGGGGLQIPAPPPPARSKAPEPERKVDLPSVSLPVRRALPPVLSVVVPRKADPPQLTRIEVPRPESAVIDPPPPIAAVQAPIVSPPTNTTNVAGLPSAGRVASEPSPGSGIGGGIGSGTGDGLGDGQGSGVGPGSGGGTGGSVFRPGSGIDPPVLWREVKPLYTEDARKRAIEGDVVLEVVVRQDGTVGSLRVTRGLGAGLDQKSVEAVRQWRFDPARRHGMPVEVVVEVSVTFKLR
jgi:TonB family protein